MRKILAAIAAALLVSGTAFGQWAEGPSADADAGRSRTEFNAGQLIAPVTLMATGLTLHYGFHETVDATVKQWAQNDLRGAGPELHFDNYIQYVPLALDLALGFAGARSEHGFVDKVLEAGLAYIALGATAPLMKVAFHNERPNTADFKSFPSGHTCFTFTAAELVRMEYGWGWGAAAYAVAGTVGFMRIYNNWHWLSDVAMGAGLGILAAHAGGWLLEPVRGWLRIPETQWGDGIHKRESKVTVSLAPYVDPLSGVPCTALAFIF